MRPLNRFGSHSPPLAAPSARASEPDVRLTAARERLTLSSPNTPPLGAGILYTRQQILTRLWGVLSNSVLERMFAHERNKLDLFEAMNRGSLILINTAKDLLKQEGCEILGRFFIALIAQAAQERASIAEDRR